MNELKRALPVIAAHFILAAAGCLVWALLVDIPESLISPFILGYRLRYAFLKFTDLVPALFISGIMLGYSMAFGKFQNHATGRWSHELFETLKFSFVLSLSAVSVFIILSEGIAPFMDSRIQQYGTLSEDYSGNISVATDFRSQGRYLEAELHAQAALQIWPESADAAKLLNDIRYDAADKSGVSAYAIPPAGSSGTVRAPGASGLTVLDAISQAREYTDAEDFFSAHYYAMLAYKLARETDPNKQVALRVAAEAWNHISSMPDSAAVRSDSRLFSIKRNGYDAIQREDWLRAYYIFSSLQDEENSSDDGLYDPDVERLFDIARDGLVGSYFFLDETVGIEPFEAARDVFFIVRHNDGTSSVVFFRGIAYKKESGRDMAYLRGFEYARFDVYGECRYRILVPYVKMLPYRSGDSGTVPQFLLHSVDRSQPGLDSVPQVLSGSVDEPMQNTLVLDMPYSDMHLVISANRGIPSMTLADLLRFGKKADTYGFSGTLIQSEIVYRLAGPFLVLILSVYALIIAWKFRFLPNMLFKAWWVLFVPVFPAVSWFAFDAARYFLRLFIIPVVTWFPSFSVPIMLAIATLIFIGASMTFFGQRGD